MEMQNDVIDAYASSGAPVIVSILQHVLDKRMYERIDGITVKACIDILR